MTQTVSLQLPGELEDWKVVLDDDKSLNRSRTSFGLLDPITPADERHRLAAKGQHDALLTAVRRIAELEQAGPELDKLREQVKHLERKEAERAKYMERLVADAHEYADDNNLCEKFDEFMEEHGLARRSHTYRVRVSREVTITEYAYVEVTASDEDEAYDLAQTEAENNHKAHSWNEGYDSRELDNYAADDIEEV